MDGRHEQDLLVARDRADAYGVRVPNGDDEEEGGAGQAIGAALIGLGLGMLVGAAVAGLPSDQRRAFGNRLAGALATYGIQLLRSDLGAATDGHVWVLSLRPPTGEVVVLNVPVHAGTDPFAAGTADAIGYRVARFLGRAA